MIAVCIATYNQQAYIAQAVQSALAQQCDEPVHIYIGDDASTDGTESVCRQLAADYPQIHYFRRTQNIGLVENTLLMYEQLLHDGCEWVAMLDGDDYWTTTDKLQEQIMFLRAHPDYGFVHTAAYDDVCGRLLEADKARKPTGDLHLCYNQHGAQTTNSTVLFRSSLLRPEDMAAIRAERFRVLDYPLYGIFSQRTCFGYIPRYTAAWRRHTSVSNPSGFFRYLVYRYHFARCWFWLDRRYGGNFHFGWFKAVRWYGWHVYVRLTQRRNTAAPICQNDGATIP